MATIGFKANDKKLSDDFDNFDFDDMGFDIKPPKDDRHPVMKSLAPVGRGAKDYITNSNNIEKFVKAALPKGYGQAYDRAGELKGELRELYNSAADEIKPVKDTAKSLLRKALPSLDGKIPRGLHDRLKDLSKAEEQWQSGQTDGREEQLGALLTSIFEQKAKDDVRQRTEVNEREKIKQGFEQIRHRDQISQLDAIRLAAEAQVQFQNRVTFNVQKKQLELSYRMFWAMADLNKEQKKSNAAIITALNDTVKNTGLPDYAKLTSKEAAIQLLRNKFMSGAGEKLFGGGKEFLNRFMKNLGGEALGKLREFSGAAGAMGGMAETMSEMGGMEGVSVQDEIISTLMSLPMDWLAEKGAKRANKLIGKHAGIRRGGDAAAYYSQTVGERAREYLTSDKRDWKKLDGLRQMLIRAMPTGAAESKMEVDSLAKQHEPQPFTRSNRKSIDEVIPGLLARIHREIKILRTGDESTPLITYDFTKNKFSTDKQVAADLKASLSRAVEVGKGKTKSLVNADDYANKILNQIDRGGKLTPEQRAKARKMLIDKAIGGTSLDISNIHSDSHWGGGADGAAIAGSFNRYLRAKDGSLTNNGQSYRRQVDLLDQQTRFTNSAGDPRALLQQLVNAGQLETLQGMGILDDKGVFNRSKWAEWISGDGAMESAAPSIPTTSASAAQVSQQREAQRRKKAPPSKRQRAQRVNVKTSHHQKVSIDLSGLQNNAASAYRYGDEMLGELRTISEALRAKEDVKGQSTVEKNVQTIADLLSAMDEKYTHAADANYSVLTMMLQRLSEIAANDVKAGAGAADAASIFTGGRARAYTSLWEHLKARGQDHLRTAKVYGRMAKRRGMRLWDKYAPKAAARLERAGNFLSDRAKDLGGKLSAYYGDVVVAGEAFPRLRATLLKAGEYRDKATGRVITSLEDITGDVVDAQGNLVITMEEFYNSYVTGSINKRVKELFTKAKSRLEDWKDRLQDFIPRTVQNLKAKALGVFNRIKEMLPPYDVYVKTDMTRPLMYANMMRYEMYFSQRNGKTIKHPRDIDGPVIDERGNVVVSEEHIKQGLVDVAGDPVGKGPARLLIKGVRKAAAAWEMMRDAAIGIFGSMQKGLGNIGEYFKNFFAPFTDMITNSRKTVNLLQLIHDMLDARLPGGKKVRGDLDGDGIRDGSLQDIHRKREQAEDDEREAAAGAGSGGKGGLASSLIAGITKLFGGKKKADDEDEDDDDDDGSLLDDAADVADIYDALDGDGRGERGSRQRRRAAKKRLKRMRGKKPGLLRRGMGKVGSALGRVGKWGAFNTTVPKAALKVGGGVGRTALGIGGTALGAAGAAGSGMARWAGGNSRSARLGRWGLFNTDIVRGAGKAIGGAGKLLPYAGKALGAAGAAYGAYSAYDNFQQGNYGMAALDAGLAGTGVATTMGGAAGLMGYGGAIAGGLGTILASPFLVPALAVAGVGALAYLGYKQLQKTRLTNLSKIRLAQYGVKDDDKDGVEKMFALEELLEPVATLKEDGNLYLDEKKLNTKEIAEVMEITRESDMQVFNMWYRRRFVPVYRRWLTELRKIDKGAKLAKIESVIPGKDKLRIAEAAVNSAGDAYSHRVGWNQSRPRLAYGSLAEVMAVLDNVRAALMKEREADGGEKASVENRTTAVSSTTAASTLAQKALTDKANYTVKDKDGNAIDTAGMEVGQLTEKIKKGDVTVSVALAVPANLLHNDKNTLDALTSIRYKAYGLVHMTADKARTLSALEQFMGDNLTADTENSKLTITTDRVMAIAGEVFGVPNPSGEHANRWKTWFNGRFLPVFLLWAGAIRKKTGKAKLIEAHRSFPLEDQTALARAIIGAQGINASGAKVSIWHILTNPWSEAYELNAEPDSTAGNLEAIRQLADKVRLGQVEGKVVKPGEPGKEVDPSKPYIGYHDPLGRRKGTGSAGRGGSGVGVNATGDTIVGGTDKEAKPLSGMGQSLRFGGGGSGNYTDLPTPTGAGWAANRELLLKAAKMAGIDPSALIATVAVESSFNPNAAPKNPNLPSSAKGLGQHLDSSWLEDLRLHGKKFGIPNGTNQFDARASALMTASRLRNNGEALQKSLGRQVTVTDLYLAHLMGLGGATKFLKSPQDAIGAEVSPTTAQQHPEYFYKNGKALTVKEVYANFAQKLAKRPAEFGVTDADMTSAASSQPSSVSTAAPAAPAADAGSAPQTQKTPPFVPQRASAATVPSAGSPSLSQPVTMDKGKAAVMGTGPAMVAGKGVKYELILQREDSEEDGTYGTLRFPDGTVLNTLELPWRNNEPRVSSIPPGQYECRKRPSVSFGAAYEVQKVPGRSAVLIHAGNSAGSADKGMKANSQGCILLGMDRGRKGNQKVITASKAAMQLFHEKMADQPFTLIIRQGKNSVATTGDKSVNLDGMRQPTVNAGVAPKQEVVPQAQTTNPNFKPSGPKVNAGVQPSVATSSDLPRLNSTPTSINPNASKQDMQQRDAAVSSVIAPKIDSMANTLLKSLEQQTAGVGVLREILTTLQGKGGSQPEKPVQSSSAEVKPPSSTEVPVPQRRSL